MDKDKSRAAWGSLLADVFARKTAKTRGRNTYKDFAGAGYDPLESYHFTEAGIMRMCRHIP